MELFIIFIVAISLSMDSFSLSLAYGTLNLSEDKEKKISIMVGIFHFFMPIIGFLIGRVILNIIKINPNIIAGTVFIILGFEMIAGVVFIVLGLEMIISLLKKEDLKVITGIFSMILFAFTVSIDSFSIGIGINAISNNIILCSSVFSLVSAIITYIGLRLGKRLNLMIGYTSNIIGSIILIGLGFFYLFY